MSQASYGAGGVETGATTLNSDGSRTVLGFDAQGHVQRVSFTHAGGGGASFVVEAGDGMSAGQAVLNQVAVALSEQILAQPAGDKHTVSQRVTLPDGELYAVTMDASGKLVFKHEHTGDGILGFVEQAVGIVLNVLAFVPVVNSVAAPLAVAWDASQAGNDFASGNYLGGVLNLASAVGVGAVGLGALAGTGGLEGELASSVLSDAGVSAPSATAFGQGVLETVGVASGASGLLNGAKSGDVAGIVTGALTVVASGAAGAVTGGTFDAPAGSSAASLTDAAAATHLATTISVAAGML